MTRPPETTPTTIGADRGDHLFLGTVGVLLGGLVGWALPHVARWIAGLPWFPFQGPTRLIASWEGSWVPWALIALGVAAGGVLALVLGRDMIAITVGAASVQVRTGEEQREFSRDAVGAVFYDAKEVVLVDREGVELVRVTPEGTAEDVAAAFVSHGWPWQDTDPHAERLTRWVEGTPALPAAANALLRARARALKAEDADDVAHLTIELGRLGFAVRDRDGRQHWCPLDPG